MTPQVCLDVVSAVRPAGVAETRAVLEQMGGRPADNELVPFGRLPGVHFARLVLIDATTALDGEPIPAQLHLMADLDGPLEPRLEELLEVAGSGLDAVFQHCEGYPGAATPAKRLAFLQAHMVAADAFYTNTIGRTVAQIRQEAQLRDAIEAFVDSEGGWSGQEPTLVRSRIQDFVKGRPDLVWATAPANERDLAWRLRELVWIVILPLLVAAVLVLILPLTLLALVVFVVLLRIHELRERPSEEKPSPQLIEKLAAIEDHGPQNQFNIVGFVKPGTFRGLTAHAVFWLTDYGVHHVFNHLSLAGVKTIHFARWVPLDGRRRVLFASNYDGSVESYMDDFIDKIAWGLNATFSSGYGYPKTDFLFFGGSHDELAFKNVLRLHQVPTHVWYAAYDRLTVLNIENNARIRAGLSGNMNGSEAQRWLALI